MDGMDERELFDKLARLEALWAGGATAGERGAAGSAAERLRERLRHAERDDPPIEYQFTTRDRWATRLLVALLRRYGLRPYRLHRQRHTTVMAKVSRRFVDETLWPEYRAMSDVLAAHLDGVAEHIIAQAVHADAAEPEQRSELPATK